MCASVSVYVQNISKSYKRIKAWPRRNQLDFCGDPDSFQDSLPLADWAQSDILQCISASYEQILMKFSGEVGCGQRTKNLDCWWRFTDLFLSLPQFFTP